MEMTSPVTRGADAKDVAWRIVLAVGGGLFGLRRRPGLAATVGPVGRVVVPLIIAVMAVRGVLEIWDDAHLIIG